MLIRPYPTTQIRWGFLPRDFQHDGFVEQGILEVRGLPTIPQATPITVQMRPMSSVWGAVRRNFPGDDTTKLDDETHWDDRGAAHVLTLAEYLRHLGLHSRCSRAAILRVWLGPEPHVEWVEPGEAEDELETPKWHSTRAAKIATLRPNPESPYVALPPLVFIGEDMIDGRHRAFAARHLGLRWAPVLDLRQPAFTQ